MENKFPLISVIIPTWNRESFIEKAITSVLNQTVPIHEIIICDDGSTDQTVNFVEAKFGNSVKVLKLSHSGQPSIVRNKGIEIATGDFIAFLDSDDTWLPNKLELQIKEINSTNSDGSSTNAFRLIPEVGIVGNLLSIKQDKISLSDLFNFNHVICSSLIIRKSVLIRAGGFPENTYFSVGEDYALWLKTLFLTDKFCYVDQPLVVYRDNPLVSVRVKSKNIIVQNIIIFGYFFWWIFKQSPINAIIIFIKFITKKFNLLLLYLYFKTIKYLCISKSLFNYSAYGFNRGNNYYHKSKNKIKPRVSIILPVYNSENFIGQAIQSILNQSFNNFELIIINDNSTDNSLLVIESFNDKRITLVNNKTNMGLAKSLNLGISISKSIYIARMDADDIADKNRLFLQYNYLEKNKEVGVVGSSIKCFGRKNYFHNYPKLHNEIRMQMIFENPMAHPTVMFRKSLVNSYNFYNINYDSIEDWELWSRLIRCTKFHNLPECLVHYRIHNVNKSFKDSYKSSKLKVMLMKKMFKEHNLPISPIFFNKNLKFTVDSFEKVIEYLLKLKKINLKKNIFLAKEFNLYLQQIINNYFLNSTGSVPKLFFILFFKRISPIRFKRDFKLSFKFFLILLLNYLGQKK